MKHLRFLLILLLWTSSIHAQTVHLKYKEQPLDEVMLEIRDDYGIDLSFANKQLSAYIITIDKSFSSAQEALEFLLLNKPLELHKIGDVYVIRQLKIMPESKNFLFTATVVDKETGERLPYAHVQINDRPLITTQNADFSFKLDADSLVQVKVSYLGFYVCDTLLAAGKHRLALQPITYQVDEVKISAFPAIHKTGESVLPGTIRLNSFVSNFLPGNGDQSVFNLLRLQPGILAAGEQSADLLIWGSYEGQSKLILDGITLFNMKNHNDNISNINPFIVKDLNVLKGGYGIDYTSRVGGIVDVTGKEGNKQKFSSALNINSHTISGEASVPLLNHKASVLVAMRQTYYELYDQSNLLVDMGKSGTSGIDRTLYPDYNFRDYNVKFSGELNANTNVQLNYLHGKDDFVYSLTLDGKQSNFIYDDAEQNVQNGWSAQINHTALNGMVSRLRVSNSTLKTTIENHQQTGGSTGNSDSRGSGPDGGSSPYQTLLNDQIENYIEETQAELETQMQLGENHQLKWILGYNHQHTNYFEDSVDINVSRFSNELNSVNLRINENWAITPKLNVNAGLLYERILKYDKNFWQPRFNLNYNIHENIDVSFAYGIYSQFVTQLPQIDDFDNIRYFWLNSNFDEIGVQKGIHKVLTFNYKYDGFKFDVNLFRINISGLTRFKDYTFSSETYGGESISNGVDFLLSRTFRHMNAWVAYTYSKTIEHFDYFASNEFERAMHDQRHELKGAMIYRLNKWHFSANYVYGSGFPDILDSGVLNEYQRLDIAVNRAFQYRRFTMNLGFSIMNMLNHQNIKYDNFYRLVDDEGEVTLHAEAVPFTPTIYLNLHF